MIQRGGVIVTSPPSNPKINTKVWPVVLSVEKKNNVKLDSTIIINYIYNILIHYINTLHILND